MMRILPRMILATAALGCFVLLPEAAMAQQERSYDYWQHQREMIKRGQQAVFMCNGLFTSKRTIEQVYERELAFFLTPSARRRVATIMLPGKSRALR